MYKFSKTFSEFIIQKEIIENSKEFIIEILSILKDKFDLNNFNLILKKFKITSVDEIKFESLDLLISYANFILKNDVISENEIQDFLILKRVFRIKEGDFTKFKKFETHEILKKEFMRIYSDNYVNEKEQLINLNLQSLFDLSYDEFENIKRDDIISSLIQGANPKDLDISQIPNGFKL